MYAGTSDAVLENLEGSWLSWTLCLVALMPVLMVLGLLVEVLAVMLVLLRILLVLLHACSSAGAHSTPVETPVERSYHMPFARHATCGT